AMQVGLVGLLLLFAPFLIGMGHVFRLAKSRARADPDLSLLGANLLACMAGTLLMMTATSFQPALAQTYYVLMGLAAGYISMRREQSVAATAESRAPLNFRRG